MMPAPPTTQFLQAGCPSCRPTNSIKALKAAAEIVVKCCSRVLLGLLTSGKSDGYVPISAVNGYVGHPCAMHPPSVAIKRYLTNTTTSTNNFTPTYCTEIYNDKCSDRIQSYCYCSTNSKSTRTMYVKISLAQLKNHIFAPAHERQY